MTTTALVIPMPAPSYVRTYAKRQPKFILEQFMTKSASSIVCRTMNSAVCAYGIEVKTAQFIPPQPYYDAVGYQTKPVAISGGLDYINAVLVGTSGDGIIISCRGTLTPTAISSSVLDWIGYKMFFFPHPDL